MAERTSLTQQIDRVLAEGREFVERIRKAYPPPEREHVKSNSTSSAGASCIAASNAEADEGPKTPRA